MRNKLVYGVGVNDADYDVNPTIGGKQLKCSFYSKWAGMLKRCYSEKYKSRNATYNGCYVCSDWLVFSKFKLWMEKQDWQGKELDKDIINKGNYLYSPENCAFVSKLSNSFITDAGARRGSLMIGVYMHGSYYRASCRNPISNRREYLGLFKSEIEAHLTWKRRKHELACKLSENESDPRVANSLKVMYSDI